MVNISPPTISLSAPQRPPQRSGGYNNAGNGNYAQGYPQNDPNIAAHGLRASQPSAPPASSTDPLAKSIPIPQRDSASSSTSPLASSAATGSLPVPTDAPIALSMSPSGHMDNSFGLSPGGRTQNGLNGSVSGRRMRSGSLFSTMSIWNDDAISQNSPGHNSGSSFLDFNDSIPGSGHSAGPQVSSSNFISPTLGAQPSSLGADTGFLSNPTRNRSHTTSGAHAYSLQHPMSSVEQQPVQQSPFVSSAPQNDKSVLFDNLMLNIPDGAVHGIGNRNRSQTYSGVASNIPDLSMAANSIMLLQQAQQNHGQSHPSGSARDRTQTPNQHLNQPNHHYRPHHDTISGASNVYQPILENDFNFSSVVITTNFENPSLGPTSTLLLDNVPQFMDAAKLWHLIASFPGAVGNPLHGRGVICVRMSATSTTKLALVECASIEVAMNLKANFNHLELVPGLILYVAFAKLSERPLPIPPHHPPQPQQSFKHAPQGNGSYQQPESSNASLKSNSGSLNAGRPSSRSSHNAKVRPQGSTEVDLPSIQGDLVHLVSTLSMLESIDINRVKLLLDHTIAFPKEKYESNFGPLPDPIPMRQFDSPKLRELRKVFEATEKANSDGSSKSDTPEKGESEPEIMTQPELEALCLAMLDELPELCYDHIGNTIVQKLFTLVESPLIKLMMVKELAPYLTQFSIHKNGTWAIQKIINLCHDDFKQMTIIAESLKPYTVKLFNDQFGNYVVQCCLKFGSPYNDFIFETMIDNFLEISYGRFGARCIRTILETASDAKSANKGYVSNEQIFLIAGMIVEFANELVVNNNGSLLITWFLETFNGCKSLKHDYRYELLCDKFLPHLGHLCTHKLANLTIFNILNNRNDIAVRQRIMNEIFGHFNEHDLEEMSARPPTVLLETILAENAEQSTGPLFIYKIVSNPMLMNIGNELSNARYKQYIIGQVKRVLLEIQITNLQPYKKLVDEVGLATNRLSRSSSTNRKSKRDRRGNKPHSPHRPAQPMIQPYMQPNQGMPPMGYGMPKMQMGEPNAGMPPNGFYQPQGEMHPGMYNGVNQDMPQLYQQRQPFAQQQQLQDVNVMQQLEQLSLSSAAMGYTSNPDTPNPGHGTRFA
ncbi:hypothetical protein FT663_03927 [Candidozyma haemuli var. vulneris]|uniref:PUM-HD domain-containing protein n=1 Tax=Candidozyma haemuli TaxID=45357 RepID=A0A2V1ARI4_9ASCO|nr:hypothetical protein CXQ85_004345 [[Candida] haemuloni]KAF3988695.1 hypothetical protein FT663_03927 [[Candida] haemuloni var. vulneris]KAF3990450.1 hypothetical protein FT662_02247 [[Candida] haemuloni var. vulneris]PVH20837.1 hypothetical protein CXQ85_004345 [[Candida] haemuloni]